MSKIADRLRGIVRLVETKEAGVLAILESLQRAADGRHTRIYVRDGSLVTPRVAGRRHADVAAANWHVLARFAGRFLELLDVPSLCRHRATFSHFSSSRAITRAVLSNRSSAARDRCGVHRN